MNIYIYINLNKTVVISSFPDYVRSIFKLDAVAHN